MNLVPRSASWECHCGPQATGQGRPPVQRNQDFAAHRVFSYISHLAEPGTCRADTVAIIADNPRAGCPSMYFVLPTPASAKWAYSFKWRVATRTWQLLPKQSCKWRLTIGKDALAVNGGSFAKTRLPSMAASQPFGVHLISISVIMGRSLLSLPAPLYGARLLIELYELLRH